MALSVLSCVLGVVFWMFKICLPVCFFVVESCFLGGVEKSDGNVLKLHSPFKIIPLKLGFWFILEEQAVVTFQKTPCFGF